MLEMLNTSKALQVIIAIFLSVAIAFFFGSVVQWITRVLFSFNYKKTLPYLAGLFGGVAITSIIYFMLIKGLQESSFVYKDWIRENTSELIWWTLGISIIVMQILHWLGVNIFKVIVLAGTPAPAAKVAPFAGGGPKIHSDGPSQACIPPKYTAIISRMHIF